MREKSLDRAYAAQSAINDPQLTIGLIEFRIGPAEIVHDLGQVCPAGEARHFQEQEPSSLNRIRYSWRARIAHAPLAERAARSRGRIRDRDDPDSKLAGRCPSFLRK